MIFSVARCHARENKIHPRSWSPFDTLKNLFISVRECDCVGKFHNCDGEITLFFSRCQREADCTGFQFLDTGLKKCLMIYMGGGHTFISNQLALVYTRGQDLPNYKRYRKTNDYLFWKNKCKARGVRLPKLGVMIVMTVFATINFHVP